MTANIKFGTDGWRGVIAEDFTFQNVRRCAQGVALYLVDSGQADKGMVVGYDTRFASEHFAAAVAEVLAGNGIKVYLCDKAAPTPVVTYAILEKRAAGNIIITASHNPPWDNGFKVRSQYAGAASPEILAEIERRIAKLKGVEQVALDEGKRQGLIEEFDPAPAYLAHLDTLIDIEPLREAGLKVVVDSMWGSGAGWLKDILSGGRMEIKEIHDKRHPLFPGMLRPEPIPPNIGFLQETVKASGADVGLATDGDADRLGVVDEKGNFVNQLQVYALLALYLLEQRGWRGPIVKTLSTTSMLYRLGELYGVPVYETGVGFKYVAPKMVETQAMIGGEESGGFAFRGHIPERDGILACLFILDFMVQKGMRPSELVDYLYSRVGPHYYDRIDSLIPPEEREAMGRRLEAARPREIAGLEVIGINTMDGFKFELEGGSWLLVRLSGTEPKIRIYGEATSEEQLKEILEEGMRLAGLERSKVVD
jgi:alpha-D-glucose phosphate-specific phosphoglucomutase